MLYKIFVHRLTHRADTSTTSLMPGRPIFNTNKHRRCLRPRVPSKCFKMPDQLRSSPFLPEHDDGEKGVACCKPSRLLRHGRRRLRRLCLRARNETSESIKAAHLYKRSPRKRTPRRAASSSCRRIGARRIAGRLGRFYVVILRRGLWLTATISNAEVTVENNNALARFSYLRA